MERRFSLPFRVFRLSILFLLFPLLAVGAEFRLTSETLLRGFERKTVDGEDVVVPIYEYLRADVGREGEQPLTFHLYGWGRVDLAGSDYFPNRFGGNDTAGELLYGYLQYDHPGTAATVRLGRQYVFEGVANESIDGLRIDTALTELFKVTAYGGWPVGLDATDGRSGDSIYGGRLAHHLRGLYEIGLSYKSVDNDSNQEEEMLGFDFSLFLPAGVSFFGTSSRNLETEGWAEHFYEARFSLGPVQIRPFFEHYTYEDYFGTGANTGGPFRFLAALGEELTVFGTDLLWQPTDAWEWGLKGKYLEYDERGGSSPFLSAIAVWHGEGLTQAGGELGRMQGDRDDDRYVLGRAFVYYDRLPEKSPFRFATADLVYVWYDEDIFNKDSSFFISVGSGTRLLNDALQLKVSADYSINPYFDDDLRGWLLASYAFSL